MRALIATAAFVLIAGTAVAEPVPRYDVDKSCRGAFRRSAFGSKDDQAAYEKCMTKTQEVYESVKGMWPQLYPDEQERCARVGTGGADTNGSYNTIADCARWAILNHRDQQKERDEDARMRNIQKKEFRY